MAHYLDDLLSGLTLAQANTLRIATLETNEKLVMPAIFTGGATITTTIRAWVRYNLTGGLGRVNLPVGSAAIDGMGVVFSNRGALTTLLTIGGSGASILTDDGEVAASTIHVGTAHARFVALYDHGSTLWEVRGVTPA